MISGYGTNHWQSNKTQNILTCNSPNHPWPAHYRPRSWGGSQPRGQFVRGQEELGIGCGFDCGGQPLPLFNAQGSNGDVRTSPIHTSKDTSQHMPPPRSGNGSSVSNPIRAHKVCCRSLGNVRSDHRITWLVPNSRENLSPVGERFSRLVVREHFFAKHTNPPENP